jgi:hypothetical protein
VRTTAGTFLGLSLGCARCHNHKFDPLTMVDYYSLAAVLAPLRRPNEGRTDRDLPAGTRSQRLALKARDEQIARLQQRIAEFKGAAKGEPTDEIKQQMAACEQEIARLKAATLDLPRGYFCFEPSPQPAPTHLLIRGRASSPGPAMEPRVPAVLVDRQPEFLPPDDYTSRRRLSLALWIASPENPLTARVIVNRVWQHHFGQGIVATPNDFGRNGAVPTHPELLDWLADWFTHEAGWSLKELHRLILTSRTYRQSSAWNEDFGRHDPENLLLWRFPYRRLDVEAIRDSMLAASGQLNRQMHGPAVFLPIPPEVIEAHTDKHQAWKESPPEETARRTVYAFTKRTLIVPMLEVLDFCDTNQSAERRINTITAPQALILYNGRFVNEQARAFADRLRAECGPSAQRTRHGQQGDPGAIEAALVERAFRLALCRPPRPEEQKALAEFLKRETEAALQNPQHAPGDDRQAAARHQALWQMCRVVLNLNEFVYPN